MATRTQIRMFHNLLKTPGREVRVQVSAQHVKGESEGTKSGRGPDPETKLNKALEDHFLPKLANHTCYFLDFKSLADKLKEADNTVLKARKDKSHFSSRRDRPLLCRVQEMGSSTASYTRTSIA